MTAPIPPRPRLIPWEGIQEALASWFRTEAPDLYGTTCRFSTCPEGLMIEPVEVVKEWRKE